jgi:hypothetical protein
VSANDRLYVAGQNTQMDGIEISFRVNDGPVLRKWCPPKWIRCSDIPKGVSGKITVTASKTGFVSDTATVTVPSSANGCHPVTKPVFLSLRRDRAPDIDTVVSTRTPEQQARTQPLIEAISQFAELCTGQDFGDDFQAAIESITETLGERCLDRAAATDPDRVIQVVFSVRPEQPLPKLEQTLEDWPIPVVTLMAANLDRSAPHRSIDSGHHSKGKTTAETIDKMRRGTSQVLSYLQECTAAPAHLSSLLGQGSQSWLEVKRLCRDEAATAVSNVRKYGIPIKGVEVRGPARVIQAIRDRTAWVTKTKVRAFSWY